MYGDFGDTPQRAFAPITEKEWFITRHAHTSVAVIKMVFALFDGICAADDYRRFREYKINGRAIYANGLGACQGGG